MERKSLVDLVATLTSGKLRYLLSDLAAMPRACVVVEDQLSAVFKLERVRPSVVAEGLAEAQVRFPSVPIVFCETRQLAQEWAYRFLGAAVVHHHEDEIGGRAAPALPAAGIVKPANSIPAAARRWAQENGIDVGSKGRLRPELWAPTGRFTHRALCARSRRQFCLQRLP